MKYILLLCALITLVTADVDFTVWHPRDTTDVRSPCPALNSLANHDILPHDGRNYTIPMLVKALGEGLNVSSEIATTLAMSGVSVSADPASGAFNLDDLNKHNALEHDASLSRKDFDLGGSSQAFDPDVFQETLSYFNGATDISVQDVAAARWGRIQKSKADNPNFVYIERQIFPTYLESSSYYQLFEDPETNLASVEWISIFFSEITIHLNTVLPD
jgi:hypothetical protein